MGKRGNISVLYDLAASQWGLVTSAQAVALGISRTQLARMANDGRLESICYGVYRTTSGAETAHMAIKAAWLSLYPQETAYERLGKRPPDSVATGRTAASLYAFGNLHATPYCFAVSVSKRTARPDLELVNADVDEQDVTHWFDIPVATLERAITDMIRTHDDPSLIDDVIADAAKKGHIFDMDRMSDLLSPLSKTHGFASGTEFAHDLIKRNAVHAITKRAAKELYQALSSSELLPILQESRATIDAEGLKSALASLTRALGQTDWGNE